MASTEKHQLEAELEVLLGEEQMRRVRRFIEKTEPNDKKGEWYIWHTFRRSWPLLCELMTTIGTLVQKR